MSEGVSATFCEVYIVLMFLMSKSPFIPMSLCRHDTLHISCDVYALYFYFFCTLDCTTCTSSSNVTSVYYGPKKP